MASVALPAAALEPRLERVGGAARDRRDQRPGLDASSPARSSRSTSCSPSARAEGVRAKQIPGAVAASHSAQVESLREELLESLAADRAAQRRDPLPLHGHRRAARHRRARRRVLVPQRSPHGAASSRSSAGLLDRGHRRCSRSARTRCCARPAGDVEDAGGEPATGRRARHPAPRRGRAAALRPLAGRGPRRRRRGRLGGVLRRRGAEPVDLPTYPFQRRRYWLETRRRRRRRRRAPASATPGTRCWRPRSTSPTARAAAHRAPLAPPATPWLADHTVLGEASLPAAAFVELALAAAAGRRRRRRSRSSLSRRPCSCPARERCSCGSASASRRRRPARELDHPLATRARAGGRRGRGLGASRQPACWPPSPRAELRRRRRVALAARGRRAARRRARLRPARRGRLRATAPPSAACGAPGAAAGPARRGRARRGPGGRRAPLRRSPGPARRGGPRRLRLAPAAGGRAAEPPLPHAWRGVRRTAGRRDGAAGPGRPGQDGVSLLACDEAGEPCSRSSRCGSGAGAGPDRARARRPLALPASIGWPRSRLCPLARAPSVSAVLGGARDPRPGGGRAICGPGGAAGGGRGRRGAARGRRGRARRRGAAGDDLAQAARATARQALELVQAWIGAGALGSSRLTFLTRRALVADRGRRPRPPARTPPGPRPHGPLRARRPFRPDRPRRRRGLAGQLPLALAAGMVEPQLAIRQGEALAPRFARSQAGEAANGRPLDPTRRC